jgi:hypothetical protein
MSKSIKNLKISKFKNLKRDIDKSYETMLQQVKQQEKMKKDQDKTQQAIVMLKIEKTEMQLESCKGL